MKVSFLHSPSPALAVMAVLLVLFSAHPALAKYAAIIVDADTGAVLHEVNADTRNYPASLTKMMTLYMTFEALGDGRFTLDQKLRASKRASNQAPSKLGLKKGQSITVRDAILALVTKSANDVATIIAESLGEDEANFARMMTRKAKEIGMSSTTFRNASGLPNRRQLSTARDLSVLARGLLTDHPEYYHFFSVQSFSHNGKTYKNHNKMLKTYSGADGIKTGYIHASGFNLAASAARYDRRLVGVVMGGLSAKSRNIHMAKLLDKGFRVIRSGVAMKDMGESQKQALLESKKKTQLATAAKAAKKAKAAPAEKARMMKMAPVKKVRKAAWGVQVGAFSRYASAHLVASSAARRLPPSLLANAKVVVLPQKEENGMIYRARLIGLDKARARHVCEELKKDNFRCMAIPPKGKVSAALSAADKQMVRK